MQRLVLVIGVVAVLSGGSAVIGCGGGGGGGGAGSGPGVAEPAAPAAPAAPATAAQPAAQERFTTALGFSVVKAAGWSVGGAGANSLTARGTSSVEGAFIVKKLAAFEISEAAMPTVKSTLQQVFAKKNPDMKIDAITLKTVAGQPTVVISGEMHMNGKPPMHVTVAVLRPAGADSMMEMTCVVLASKATTIMQACERMFATAEATTP